MRAEEEEKEPKIGWKDYLAMVIALLQTVMLPFIILLVMSIIVGFLILHLFA